jgi:RNA polymerase sigma factor (TIGR02999 family)
MSDTNGGATETSTELFQAIYDQLRRLAEAQLSGGPTGTLTATALVHEAFIRLSQVAWQDRRHFLNAAAQAMRHILISHARHRRALKRGGDARRLELEDLDLAVLPPDDELLALDEALTEFTVHDPRGAELVRLRYFAGASWGDIAVALGRTEAEVRAEWAFARAWLFARLTAGASGNP